MTSKKSPTVEKSLKVSVEVHAAMMAAKPEGVTVSRFISQLLAAQQTALPAELPEGVQKKVQDAIAQGADIKKLLENGLYWSASRYVGQSDRSAAINFSTMSDEELEAIDLKQAKQMKGLAEEKIRRTIARLQAWNEAHPQQPIDITASFVLDLRDLLKRLTAGRITGVSRNVVFDYCKTIDLKSTFPRGHNATINAEALAVQAFRDLIEDKIEPIYRSVYESYLAS